MADSGRSFFAEMWRAGSEEGELPQSDVSTLSVASLAPCPATPAFSFSARVDNVPAALQPESAHTVNSARPSAIAHNSSDDSCSAVAVASSLDNISHLAQAVRTQQAAPSCKCKCDSTIASHEGNSKANIEEANVAEAARLKAERAELEKAKADCRRTEREAQNELLQARQVAAQAIADSEVAKQQSRQEIEKAWDDIEDAKIALRMREDAIKPSETSIRKREVSVKNKEQSLIEFAADIRRYTDSLEKEIEDLRRQLGSREHSSTISPAKMSADGQTHEASITNPTSSPATSSSDDTSDESKSKRRKLSFNPNYAKRYNMDFTLRYVSGNTFEIVFSGGHFSVQPSGSHPPENQSDTIELDGRTKLHLQAMVLSKMCQVVDGTEFKRLNLTTNYNINSRFIRRYGFVKVIENRFTGCFLPPEKDNETAPVKCNPTAYGYEELKCRPLLVIDFDEDHIYGVMCYTYGKRELDDLPDFIRKSCIPIQRVEMQKTIPLDTRKDEHIRIASYPGSDQAYMSTIVYKIPVIAPMCRFAGFLVHEDRSYLETLIAPHVSNILAVPADDNLPVHPHELKDARKEEAQHAGLNDK